MESLGDYLKRFAVELPLGLQEAFVLAVLYTVTSWVWWIGRRVRGDEDEQR